MQGILGHVILKLVDFFFFRGASYVMYSFLTKWNLPFVVTYILLCCSSLCKKLDLSS